MQNFKLKKGQILVSGDGLRIEGDSAARNQWLIVAGAFCFTLLIGFRVYEYYRALQDGAGHHGGTMWVIAIQLLTMLVWWYLCYLHVFKKSTQQEISLAEVEWAKRTLRPADKVPVVTLYLKSHRRRELLLMHSSVDSFTAWLKTQGIVLQ